MLLFFFFLFSAVLNSFFTIPAVIENAKLKISLAIPTRAPMTVEMIQ